MKILHTIQVAEILGRTQETIRKMCIDGRLPAIKIGDRWFILEEKLEEMLTLTDFSKR